MTFFAALELRHYLASAARLVGIPTGVAVYLRVTAQAVSRCGDVLRTNPVLSLYACMWLLIWLRMVTGTMRVSPPDAARMRLDPLSNDGRLVLGGHFPSSDDSSAVASASCGAFLASIS